MTFTAKVRAVYRNGRGYSFERLRAKVLYADMLRKRVKVQEKGRWKRMRYLIRLLTSPFRWRARRLDDAWQLV